MIPWHGNRALKLFHAGIPNAVVRTEYLNAQAAFAQGIATPRVEEMVRIGDREGIVFERCNGTTLYSLLLNGAPQVEALADIFYGLQHSIHVQPSSAFASQLPQLRRAIQRAPDVADECKDFALQQMDKAGGILGLCHGDFHPMNVLLTREGAVAIDWLDASQGHPAADVARTLLLLEFGRIGEGPPAQRAAFLAAYRQRCASDFTTGQLDAWHLPVLIGRLSEPLGRSERALLLARAQQICSTQRRSSAA